MTINDHIKHWIESADHDLETCETLFKSGKFDWCLFIGHLVIEKTLKAMYVKINNNKMPPKIHNLIRLSELSNIKLNTEQKLFLDRINDFNLEARYPEFKNEFYKTCTKEFTEEYLTKIKEYYQWLKSLIQ